MLHHRTENPAIRAGHIADREAEDLENLRASQGEFAYENWPRYWLDIYQTTLLEIGGDCDQRGNEATDHSTGSRDPKDYSAA